MSTRSTITVCESPGKYITAYCHFDGYPEHHMEILPVHYNTLEKALELVKGGDMSVLDNSCECPPGHSFENKIEGYTVYYHRDRGEKWEQTKPKEFDHWPTSEDLDMWQEYEYLFEDGAWRYREA